MLVASASYRIMDEKDTFGGDVSMMYMESTPSGVTDGTMPSHVLMSAVLAQQTVSPAVCQYVYYNGSFLYTNNKIA